MFRPNRPSLTWETVTICFAAKIGCTNGACTVPKTVILLVLASSPHAHLIVSNVLPSKSVSPPYPFHRAMGSKNSMPASSAICASFKLFSQEASQRSGTLVTAIPPEQLGEKMPSFSLFPLNMVVPGVWPAAGMFSPRIETRVCRQSNRRIIRAAPPKMKQRYLPRLQGALVSQHKQTGSRPDCGPPAPKRPLSAKDRVVG